MRSMGLPQAGGAPQPQASLLARQQNQGTQARRPDDDFGERQGGGQIERAAHRLFRREASAKRMSAKGQERRFRPQSATSALPPLATLKAHLAHFAFVPRMGLDRCSIE